MKIPKEARKLSREFFQASFKDGVLQDDRLRYIAKRLIETKPRHYVRVLQALARLVRLEQERHHAVIESATALEPATREQLENNLRARHGSAVTTDFKVTPALLGGLRIKIGNDVFDSSVRERLNRLQAAAA